mgnify:CR=1 FL=1
MNFVSRGVRGTFATGRATLVVKSQGRLLPVSLFRAIAVSSRATLSVKSRGRPSLCGGNRAPARLRGRAGGGVRSRGHPDLRGRGPDRRVVAPVPLRFRRVLHRV